jgi:hypothetical protein
MESISVKLLAAQVGTFSSTYIEPERLPVPSVNDKVNSNCCPFVRTVVLTDLNFSTGFEPNLSLLQPVSIANKNIENKIVYRIFVV